MSRIALVTGGGGYIGSALCRALQGRGWRVLATARDPAIVTATPCIALELEDAAAGHVAAQVCRDAEVVFHLAGIAHRGADALALERINCDATLALARAAEAAGVAHFVYLSSLYAGACDPGAPGARGDAYARSKRLAELGLLGAEPNWRMRVTIVRPALVYGGAMKGRLATLRALALKGWLPDLPPVGNTPMIALPDLVHALALLGAHPTISGNIFTVSDGERYPLDRVARAMHRLAGRGGGAWRVPAGAFAWALAAAARLGRLPVLGSRLALPRGLAEWEVEPDQRLRALGWTPALSLETALAPAMPDGERA